MMTLTTAIFPQIQNPTANDMVRVLDTLPRLRDDVNYVVVDSCADPASYLQGRPEVGGNGAFRVEYRDGEAQRHFMCWLDSVEEAHTLFLSYLAQDDLYRKMVWWRDITHSFPDLKPSDVKVDIPHESEFFDENEWKERKTFQQQKLEEWHEVADELE